jgi:hypothetical protein
MHSSPVKAVRFYSVSIYIKRLIAHFQRKNVTDVFLIMVIKLNICLLLRNFNLVYQIGEDVPDFVTMELVSDVMTETMMRLTSAMEEVCFFQFHIF